MVDLVHALTPEHYTFNGRKQDFGAHMATATGQLRITCLERA